MNNQLTSLQKGNEIELNGNNWSVICILDSVTYNGSKYTFRPIGNKHYTAKGIKFYAYVDGNETRWEMNEEPLLVQPSFRALKVN